MKMLSTVMMGRCLFAIAVIGMGLVHFCSGNYPGAFMLASPPTGLSLALMYIAGFAFFLSGILMLTKKYAWFGALGSGLLFLLICLFSELPKLAPDLHAGGQWTVTAEMLALSSGAFILFAALYAETHVYRRKLMLLTARIASYTLAISLLIFAVLHYVYADFIVTLIPSWVPAKMMLNYLIMIGFAAAAISILTRIFTAAAGICMGSMFLVWVAILHLPRCMMNLKTEAEWTSMLIALAMAGIGFLVAGFSNTRLFPENRLSK